MRSGREEEGGGEKDNAIFDSISLTQKILNDRALWLWLGAGKSNAHATIAALLARNRLLQESCAQSQAKVQDLQKEVATLAIMHDARIERLQVRRINRCGQISVQGESPSLLSLPFFSASFSLPLPASPSRSLPPSLPPRTPSLCACSLLRLFRRHWHGWT